jgi:hypothetical protein
MKKMAELVRKTTEDKKDYPTQFQMVKNFMGGMSIRLEPHDFSGPSRKVKFRHDVDTQYVPAKYALGVFVSDENSRLMERGYFTFANLSTLIEMAEELGYYIPDSIKNPKMTIKEIRNLLKKADESEIEKALLNATKKTIEDFIAVAKKMYTSLNISTVKYIEKKYKISLAPIDLNA